MTDKEKTDIDKAWEEVQKKAKYQKTVIVKLFNILKEEQMTYEEGLEILSKAHSVLEKTSLRNKI